MLAEAEDSMVSVLWKITGPFFMEYIPKRHRHLKTRAGLKLSIFDDYRKATLSLNIRNCY